MKGKNKVNDRKFVTSTGWIFLIIAGLTALSSMAQILISINPVSIEATINKIFPGMSNQFLSIMPPIGIYSLQHPFLIGYITLIFSIPMIWGAWALLKFRNWGRIFFIFILGFSIILGFLPLFFPKQFMYQFSTDPILQQTIQTMNQIMHALLVISAVAIAILHSWIIYKFISPEIRNEFKS